MRPAPHQWRGVIEEYRELLDIPEGTVLHELWSGTKRRWNGPFSVRVPPHGCLYYRFDTPGAALAAAGSRPKPGARRRSTARR